MQKCTRCKKEKNDEDFIDAKGVERKQCVDCRTRVKENMSEEALKNKRAQAKAWRDKNKERVKLYNEHQRKLANYENSDWNEIKEQQNYQDNITGKPSPNRKLHTFIDGVEGKSCSKCKTWKPLESYNNLKSSWDGLRIDCKDCLEEYRAGRKEEMTEYNKEYWVKTKDIQTKKHKIWKEANREHVNEYSRNFKRIWEKNQRETNTKFKIVKNLRCRLYQAIKFGYGVKNESTLNLLSCSLDFFQGYMESKFQDGMTWENYGKWHIDHIIPCNSWDLSQEEEVKMCFHYLNLQPMWGSENSSKKDKFNPEDKIKYIEKYKTQVNKISDYTQKQRLNDFYELNEWICNSGGILLSNICDLIDVETELNVFCHCGNTFKMCYLEMGFKGCEVCSSKDDNEDMQIDVNLTKPTKRSVEI